MFFDLTRRKIALAPTVTCKRNQLLGYKRGGAVLAKNTDSSTLSYVVIAAGDSRNGYVDVYDEATILNFPGAVDGATAYVGANGDVVFAQPTVSECYVKNVGHIEGSTLFFKTDSIALQLK